jgi:hypothetical protein
MTTPVNVNQLFLPSALQIGPGGELITFDAAGNPIVFDPNDPLAPISIAAANVTYDNTGTGFTATDVQAAINEIDVILGGPGGSLTPGGVGDALKALRVDPTGSFLEFSTTEALLVDSGTTLERPGAAVNGMIRYNTDDNQFEGYIDGSWQPIGTGGGGSGISVGIDSVVYVGGVDFNNPGPDDTLAVPTPNAGSEDELFIFFDGIFQNNTTWNLINSGADVQFVANIPGFVSEVEIRQVVSTATAVPLTMQEIIAQDGVDYTAGGGGPDTFALPADPGSIENVWVSFDGIDQFDGFTLGAAPDITFAAGIPNGISEVRVKFGAVQAPALDMDDVIVTGPFVGDPYDILLPTDPGTLENVWIYYNGVHQYPDPLVFSLTAGPNLSIAGGVPAGVDEIYVKLGTATGGATPSFDIASLPAGTADDNNDLIAIADVDDSNNMKNISISSFRQLIGPADFVSTDQTWSNAGGTQVTVAHGLGVVPSLLQINWVCVAPEAGYLAGDVIQYVAGSQENPGAVGVSFRGYIAYANSTDVNVVIGTGGVALPNASTGANDPLNSANWRVRVLAWY